MKINDVRMAHGKRELSMDEAAQVVGGVSWDTIDFYGEEMSMADFNEMMIDFAEKLGFDVAAILFEEFTGFPCYGTHYGEYVYGNTDRDMMEMALQDFWITRYIGPY